MAVDGAAAGAGGGSDPNGDLATLRRVLALVGIAELWLAVAAFAAVVLLTIVQVGLRYFFDASLWWAQEVSQMMILVAYFQGIAYAFKTRQYIVINFLAERLSPAAQLRCYLLAQLLVVVFCGVVLVEGAAILPRQYLMLTYILHIPRMYLGLPLLLAAASMIATSVYYALAVWRASRREPDAAAPDIEARRLVVQPVGEL